jgi:hypothetical protein
MLFYHMDAPSISFPDATVIAFDLIGGLLSRGCLCMQSNADSQLRRSNILIVPLNQSIIFFHVSEPLTPRPITVFNPHTIAKLFVPHQSL